MCLVSTVWVPGVDCTGRTGYGSTGRVGLHVTAGEASIAWLRSPPRPPPPPPMVLCPPGTPLPSAGHHTALAGGGGGGAAVRRPSYYTLLGLGVDLGCWAAGASTTHTALLSGGHLPFQVYSRHALRTPGWRHG